MFRVIKGDQKGDMWLTNWLEKRHITSPAEVNAIIKAGVTNGAGLVTWPQAWVDAIPVIENDPNGRSGLLAGERAVLELGLHVVAVHERDEVDRDLLRARRLALAVVRARAEPPLHLLDHRRRPA